MSGKAFLALIVGLLLAAAGLALLVWLLRWLWTGEQPEKKAPALEIEIEPPLPPQIAGRAEPETAAEEISLAMPQAVDEPVVLASRLQEEPAIIAAGPEIVEPWGDLEPQAERAASPLAPAPDDLKKIEGIGPKIAGVLREANIATFAQLAATTVSRLEEILEAADPRLRRIADPTTWPEQASLAAAGQWEALEALQNGLKGGRRAT